MASEIMNSRREDPVLQFSVTTDNKVGRLNALVQLLAANDIHVLAISMQDNAEASLMRFIVNYPDQAKPLLIENGFVFTLTELVAVELDSIRRITEVTCTLSAAEINISYVYPFLFRSNNRSALAMKLEDNDLAASVLSSSGFRILKQQDLGR